MVCTDGCDEARIVQYLYKQFITCISLSSVKRISVFEGEGRGRRGNKSFIYKIYLVTANVTVNEMRFNK
jgi:hypothetical protein